MPDKDEPPSRGAGKQVRRPLRTQNVVATPAASRSRPSLNKPQPGTSKPQMSMAELKARPLPPPPQLDESPAKAERKPTMKQVYGDITTEQCKDILRAALDADERAKLPRPYATAPHDYSFVYEDDELNTIHQDLLHPKFDVYKMSQKDLCVYASELRENFYEITANLRRANDHIRALKAEVNQHEDAIIKRDTEFREMKKSLHVLHMKTLDEESLPHGCGCNKFKAELLQEFHDRKRQQEEVIKKAKQEAKQKADEMAKKELEIETRALERDYERKLTDWKSHDKAEFMAIESKLRKEKAAIRLEMAAVEVKFALYKSDTDVMLKDQQQKIESQKCFYCSRTVGKADQELAITDCLHGDECSCLDWYNDLHMICLLFRYSMTEVVSCVGRVVLWVRGFHCLCSHPACMKLVDSWKPFIEKTYATYYLISLALQKYSKGRSTELVTKLKVLKPSRPEWRLDLEMAAIFDIIEKDESMTKLKAMAIHVKDIERQPSRPQARLMEHVARIQNNPRCDGSSVKQEDIATIESKPECDNTSVQQNDDETIVVAEENIVKKADVAKDRSKPECNRTCIKLQIQVVNASDEGSDASVVEGEEMVEDIPTDLVAGNLRVLATGLKVAAKDVTETGKSLKKLQIGVAKAEVKNLKLLAQQTIDATKNRKSLIKLQYEATKAEAKRMKALANQLKDAAKDDKALEKLQKKAAKKGGKYAKALSKQQKKVVAKRKKAMKKLEKKAKKKAKKYAKSLAKANKKAAKVYAKNEKVIEKQKEKVSKAAAKSLKAQAKLREANAKNAKALKKQRKEASKALTKSEKKAAKAAAKLLKAQEAIERQKSIIAEKRDALAAKAQSIEAAAEEKRQSWIDSLKEMDTADQKDGSNGKKSVRKKVRGAFKHVRKNVKRAKKRIMKPFKGKHVEEGVGSISIQREALDEIAMKSDVKSVLGVEVAQGVCEEEQKPVQNEVQNEEATKVEDEKLKMANQGKDTSEEKETEQVQNEVQEHVEEGVNIISIQKEALDEIAMKSDVKSVPGVEVAQGVCEEEQKPVQNEVQNEEATKVEDEKLKMANQGRDTLEEKETEQVQNEVRKHVEESVNIISIQKESSDDIKSDAESFLGIEVAPENIEEKPVKNVEATKAEVEKMEERTKQERDVTVAAAEDEGKQQNEAVIIQGAYMKAYSKQQKKVAAGHKKAMKELEKKAKEKAKKYAESLKKGDKYSAKIYAENEKVIEKQKKKANKAEAKNLKARSKLQEAEANISAKGGEFWKKQRKEILKALAESEEKAAKAAAKRLKAEQAIARQESNMVERRRALAAKAQAIEAAAEEKRQLWKDSLKEMDTAEPQDGSKHKTSVRKKMRGAFKHVRKNVKHAKSRVMKQFKGKPVEDDVFDCGSIQREALDDIAINSNVKSSLSVEVAHEVLEEEERKPVRNEVQSEKATKAEEKNLKMARQEKDVAEVKEDAPVQNAVQNHVEESVINIRIQKEASDDIIIMSDLESVLSMEAADEDIHEEDEDKPVQNAVQSKEATKAEEKTIKIAKHEKDATGVIEEAPVQNEIQKRVEERINSVCIRKKASDDVVTLSDVESDLSVDVAHENICERVQNEESTKVEATKMAKQGDNGKEPAQVEVQNEAATKAEAKELEKMAKQEKDAAKTAVKGNGEQQNEAVMVQGAYMKAWSKQQKKVAAHSKKAMKELEKKAKGKAKKYSKSLKKEDKFVAKLYAKNEKVIEKQKEKVHKAEAKNLKARSKLQEAEANISARGGEFWEKQRKEALKASTKSVEKATKAAAKQLKAQRAIARHELNVAERRRALAAKAQSIEAAAEEKRKLWIDSLNLMDAAEREAQLRRDRQQQNKKETREASGEEYVYKAAPKDGSKPKISVRKKFRGAFKHVRKNVKNAKSRVLRRFKGKRVEESVDNISIRTDASYNIAMFSDVGSDLSLEIGSEEDLEEEEEKPLQIEVQNEVQNEGSTSEIFYTEVEDFRLSDTEDN